MNDKKLKHNMHKWLWLLIILTTCHHTFAQEVSKTTMQSPLNMWQRTLNHLDTIAYTGKAALYLSGWTHHGRGTYTRKKINELNEHAWGLGAGRTLRNARGNDESLYFLGISDSHRDPQLTLGYIHEWIWKIPHTPIEIGAGGTVLLGSRQDYLGGFPLPFIAPVATIGIQKAKLMFAYVPRFSKNRNSGDVLLVFACFEVE